MEKVQKNLPFCYVCKKSSPNFYIHSQCRKGIFLDALIVPYHYREKIIKKAITDGKFYKKQELFEELAKYIVPFLRDDLEKYHPNDIVITPIPLHFLRHWKRGYNQSEVLGKNLVNETHIQYLNLLKKQRHTRQQSHLSRKERIQNIKDCFAIKKNMVDKVDNKIILLVDDVVSTGATLNEAAKVLKKQGAKKVIGVVIGSD